MDPKALDSTSAETRQPQERTCDRCKIRVIEEGLDELFELLEFLQVQIYAGYGARRFADGDIWEVNLCQDCAFDMFSPYARLIASEDDEVRDPSPLDVVGTLFDPNFHFDDVPQRLDSEGAPPISEDAVAKLPDQ